MEEIPPGAHLFQMPQLTPQPLAKTERLVTFRNCNLGFAVNIDPDGKVVGYEMQIHDKQESTVYTFAFDERHRDIFCDHLISLPGIGTVQGSQEVGTDPGTNGQSHAA